MLKITSSPQAYILKTPRDRGRSGMRAQKYPAESTSSMTAVTGDNGLHRTVSRPARFEFPGQADYPIRSFALTWPPIHGVANDPEHDYCLS
jgi:hypothetical protein